MRRSLLAIIAFSAIIAATAARSQDAAKAGEYDYLVLALSWSPSFCATKTGKDDGEQCGAKRPAGFVVHGLWPQFQKGGYPANCAASSEVPGKVAEQILPLMPSHRLIRGQWNKHGTCYAGDPAAYFARTKAAYDKVKVPAALKAPDKAATMAAGQIEKAFLDANPGLSAEGVAVTCRRPRAAPAAAGKPAATPDKASLSEVRLCFDKDLKFRACGGRVKDNCKGDVLVPAAK